MMQVLFKENIANKKLTSIDICFGEEVVNFPVTSGVGSVLSKPEEIFTAVNALLRNFNVEESNELFGLYDDLNSLRNYENSVGGESSNQTIEELTEMAEKLFSILLPGKIAAWGSNYIHFVVPEKIQSVVVPDPKFPRCDSYNAVEYRELCTLSTLFKLILPFLLGFNKFFSDRSRVDLKEYYILKLFSETGIFELPAFVKVMEQTINRCSDKMGGINVPTGLLMDAIGEEDYPIYIIAPVLLRILSMSETNTGVRDALIPNNIAARLAGAITVGVTTANNNHQYRDMKHPRDSGMDTGNTSNRELEDKKVQRFSGLYGEFYSALCCKEDLPKRLGIDEVMFNDIIALFGDGTRVFIDDIKSVIVNLCFPTWMDVEANEIINYRSALRMYAAAAVKCHSLGLFGIVNFILSFKGEENEETNVYNADAVKVALDQETLRLLHYYSTPAVDGKQNIVTDIENIVKILAGLDLIQVTPSKYHESYGVHRAFNLSPTIKRELASLVIYREQTIISEKERREAFNNSQKHNQ